MKLLNDSPLQPIFMVTEPVPGRFQLTLIVKGTFQLSPGGIASTLDDQAPIDGDKPWDEETGSLRYPTDLAPFKPNADLLLAGHFYAPKSTPVTSSHVAFQIGNNRKVLNVHGPRKWNPISGTVSAPDPIQSLPLRYEHALGGPQDSSNPIGIGRSPTVGSDGTETWLAPQLEWQTTPFANPRDATGPACFCPLRMNWQPRLKKAGTYDETWQKERWPFMPADFDWGYFNAAPPELQLPGYLTGNEPLQFENLHPQHSLYVSQLPGKRIRSFLTYPSQHEEGSPTYQLVETPMRLDTLFVDMDKEQLSLVWRGVIEVRSEQVEEYAHWFVIDESLSETPKSYALCDQRFRTCLKAQEDEDAIMTDEEIEAHNEELKQVFGDDAPEIPSDLNSKPKQDQISTFMQVGELVRLKSQQDSEAKLKSAGIDPKQAASQRQSISTQRMRATGAHKEGWSNIKKMEKQGLPTHQARSELHAQGLGPDIPSSNPEPITQENFAARLESGESFAGRDLTELDLSQADLRNVDFRDAYLAEVSLAGADLTGAQLDGISAAGADFTEATLDHASASNADLAGAKFVNASLNHINVTMTNLEGCDFTGASMLGITATKTLFVQCNLSRVQLSRSSCQQADFSESNLDQLNATEVDFKQAVLQSVQGDRPDFTGARLVKARIAQGAELSHARFHQVEASEAIFLSSTFMQTDFSHSNFSGAFFNGASLQSCDCKASDFSGAHFHQADLTKANFGHANLFEANLHEAICCETDFRNANAYSANLMDSDLTDADLRQMNHRGTQLDQKPQHKFRGKKAKTSTAGAS